MSVATKKAMEQSLEAVMNCDSTWNSIDVLIGIVRQGASPAAEILEGVGVTIDFIDYVIHASNISHFLDDSQSVTNNIRENLKDLDGSLPANTVCLHGRLRRSPHGHSSAGLSAIMLRS